jgi:hypothetical protein
MKVSESELRMFCRLDISIFLRSDTNVYQYFVNEIATTHKAGLFLPFLDNASVWRLASDYASALRAWVAIRRSKLAEK